MSNEIGDNNDLLTTDAVSSPPRDDLNNSDNRSSSEQKKTVPPPRPPRNANYRIPKSNAKRLNSHASATVINISGSNGVHIGSNYNIFMKGKSEPNDEKSNSNQDIKLTEKINKVLNCSRNLTKTDILHISPHFNYEHWQDIARCLNYSEGQISQFKIDYINNGVKEVIIQFLLDWMRNDDEPKVSRLANILWNTNQRDVVDIWSNLL